MPDKTFIQDYATEANDSLNNLDGYFEDGLDPDAFYDAKNAVENLVYYRDVPDEAMRVLALVRDNLYAGGEVTEETMQEVFTWWDKYDNLLDRLNLLNY
jgi:hypothetical protein